MKKVVITLFALVLVASLFAFVSAANETVNTSAAENTDGMEKSFNCLATALKADCSGATKIEDLALAVLASTNVSDKCLENLKAKKQTDNCWGDSGCTVRETALAILALDHAKEDTSLAEEWILSKKRTSTDLIWYLQQDSNEKAECKFSYLYNNGSQEKIVQIYENKKISGSAGPCLSLSQGSFWLEVAPNCYNSEFTVSCNTDFLATLLYKQKTSPIIYVLSDTGFAPKLEDVTLSLKSFCFGDSSSANSCSYPATVWAAIALLQTDHSVDDFLPYILAMEESNKQYLPKAFSYMVTEENEYAIQLIEQKGGLNDYWKAENTANDQYYDTALAYLSSSGISSEVDDSTRKWLNLYKKEDGCWAGNSGTLIKDTAMVLWALEGRSFRGNPNVLPQTRCEDADYWCMPASQCILGTDVSDNYFCGSTIRDTCCTNSNLKDCSELEGTICEDGFTCDAATQDSNQGTCCLGQCEEEQTPPECELKNDKYFCKSACNSNQVKKSFSCDDSDLVCCGPSESNGGSSAWIWILIILIILVLAGIGYVYREKIKLWWFKLKAKFRKDKGKGSSNTNGGIPPKPGFPPIRGPPMRRPMPPQRPPVSAPARGQLDDVFKKLHDMSK